MTEANFSNRTFLYYLKVLYRRRWFLAILVLIASATTLATALRSAPVYRSTATILLIEGQGGGAFDAVQSGFGALGIMLRGGSASSAKVITAILKSQRMANNIQEHFGFQERFQIGREQAIQRAKGMLTIYDWDTTLGVEVTGGDPQFIADVANFCVKNLDSLNQELNISTEKPFVRLLDPAEVPKRPIPREIKKRMLVSALTVFLLGSLFVLFADYLRRLKEVETLSHAFEKEELKI